MSGNAAARREARVRRMMRTFLNVGFRILLTVNATMVVMPRSVAEESTSPSAGDVEARIQRVEAGLQPAVAIAGEPAMKLADRMNDLHVPGVSIALIHDGAIQWARGFGVAAVGGPPVTPDTLFQAGSISKPVSAVAALALVQAGKLDLDTDVNLFLKSWKVPANSYTAKSNVTLRELLNHSAGTTVHGFAGYQAGAVVPSLAEVLNGAPPANNDPIVVDHRPGARFRYSGGGYTIMQQMLLDVTGRDFPSLLDDTVLRPFGMTHSSFLQPLPVGETSAATPYLADGAPVPGGPHIYPELAAAGLWTTPTDLAHFALALLDAWRGRANPVLSQSMASQMLTPGLGDYGLGPVVSGSPPNRRFSHGGVDEGFVSFMVAYETGDGAVVMTNGERGGDLAGEIMRSIAAEYHWPNGQAVLRKRTTVDPKLLDRFVGNYQLSPRFFIQISREGDHLFSQATGQGKYEIFPESDRDFFLTEVDVVITFETDGQADATRLILHQDGTDHPARRVR
ncbi:serine hydrolase [Mesorhizobium sp. PAMC28654]|uniref:serine hydrolase n=1 Tax=Mesorhizobium sp. PAMC28654 TaxID=2880934 RepID=UPI001D0BBC75|nr:serine hydrolase [Mesorhizobium sp. PAMC28654]UDL89795.1 serine hydrolase [Mesorhizobium sp. PAMC28654]